MYSQIINQKKKKGAKFIFELNVFTFCKSQLITLEVGLYGFASHGPVGSLNIFGTFRKLLKNTPLIRNISILLYVLVNIIFILNPNKVPHNMR